MTDEEFEREIEDLAENLRNLRRIPDRGRRQWLKAEIRHQLTGLMKG